MSFAFDIDYPVGPAASAATSTSPLDKPGPEPGQQRSRQQPGSACDECRRRKLRCNRATPQCLACANSGTKCVVRSTCPPRGPRKGYLRELQKQIEHLQTQVNEQNREEGSKTSQAAADTTLSSSTSSTASISGSATSASSRQAPGIDNEDLIHIRGPSAGQFGEMQPWAGSVVGSLDMSLPLSSLNFEIDGLGSGGGGGGSGDSSNNNSMAVFSSPFDQQAAITPTHQTLGLEIFLTPIICADLDQLYFDRVHPFAPILQKFRYLSWARQPDKSKQRTCLQYAMWTLAASLSSQFQLLRLHLYAEARQRLDAFETDNQNTLTYCVEQVQAWILLAIYELTSNTCNYQRGMVSAGRAFRLAQLMRLNELDGPNSIAAATMCQGQGDWIDMESMRRTFWVVYTVDRFTSALDGLPLTFNERQIYTRLPAPESHFMSGRATNMCFLSEVVNGTGGGEFCVSEMSDSMHTTLPFTESIIIATICGRTLEQKQDPFQQFPDQDHQALRALLTHRINTLSVRMSSTSEHPDAMLLFVALTAYMVVFMLSDGTDTMPLCAELVDAVQQVGVLTATLGQLNHFQTHPFTPIPLLLGARFCMANKHSQDSACIHLETRLAAALEGLAHVNGLAQNFPRLLQGLSPV
ncbi:fungal-specific transcription factor domain-containing protein [Stachybotrys elegans]|uniref:Fungal-specific transcription factor domain-containing protein n=1 Tax=Stachybotrys elegans TaxID=80388 RepID=A0A8K0WTU0_9HYPO|nr:fungal-specific transcription factor domain-containing protein [Stachybotrys elegans]